MRWEDERYMRLYTRDTTNWVLAPWQGRAVLPLVARKLDRSGMLDLGEDGLEGLAALIQMPLEVVTDGMAWWLKRKTFELQGTVLVMPNYLEAQECRSSDKKRAREHRERARDSATRLVTNRDASVTERDDTDTVRDVSSQPVTRRHTPSPTVTPSHATPRHAVPYQDPPVGAPAPPVTTTSSEKPAGERRTRGTRMAPDWEPSPETLERFRTQERVNARLSLERFRNHFIASRNGNAVKLDWERTFVNWVLEDIDRGKLATMPVDDAPPEYRPPEVTDRCSPEEAKAHGAKLLTLLRSPQPIPEAK